MSMPVAVVKGTVRPDGTLEVLDKINLPPGEVRVTLVPVAKVPAEDPFWQLMLGIWADQQARGHVPRVAEEVEAELAASRREWEDRMTRIDQIRREAERLREGRRPE